MRLNLADIRSRFPGLYNYKLLIRHREERGWSERETARRAKVSYGAIQRVFGGNAPPRKVWPVAKALGVDWAMLHDLKLKESEFHLAAANGDSKVAR